jgi:hypothetical protein
MLRSPLLLILTPFTAAAADVSFNRDVRPILTENCYNCHGPDASSRKANLRLDGADYSTRPAKSGAVAVVPGKPDESELVKRIFTTDHDDQMPPAETHRVLSPEQKETLRRWIEQGAKYEGHWAFVKPVRPRVPELSAQSAQKKPGSAEHRELSTPVDHFIRKELERHALPPSPRADNHTLARRAALDLTGLPPETEVLAAFLADTSPDAWPRYVDKLLATPHYGERWARLWMDIARYADSAGYGSDPLRLNMWPWRDWVIRAFNDNLPYDKFTLYQLAGDLLPDATTEQVVATGFHRNTMTNTEGGTDDEEWRVAAVKDRAAVTAQAWMGLTMGCAQCHSHKFDPISQEEYYRFYALFNQTEDNDQPGEQPLHPVPTAAELAKMETLKKEIAALEESIAQPSAELEKELVEWEQRVKSPAAWETLEITGMNKPYELKPDGSVLAGNPGSDAVTYSLDARTKLKRITGVQLQVLPDDSLPGKGPGRSSAGNAVISEVSITAVAAGGASPSVRFIRVEAPGKNRFLHLAEVEANFGKENLARAGRASQSSTDYGGDAARGIDGNTNGVFDKGSVTHTKQEKDPWWEVDLGAEKQVERVVVWNRAEAGERLTNWRVLALDAKRQPIWRRDVKEPPSPNFETQLDRSRSVTIARVTADFSQDGWDAARAADGKPDTGWAWAPQFGKEHRAVFVFAQPLVLEDDMGISVKIAQNFGSGHAVGRFRLSATTADCVPEELPEPIRAILAAASRSTEQQKALLDYFRPHSKALAALHTKVDEKKRTLAAIKPVAVPVMRELPRDKQRKTHFLNKGNFLDPGAEVQPGFPVAFGALPADAAMDRRGVVQWLFSAENPLTARVAVNRFWAALLGTGLVETEEDFGMQGTFPSHPELLDWLAVEFRESGWDVKRLLKLIVTSDTYCQASAVSPAAVEKDPRNRLLSHYPRRRLDAEQVRDQALMLSGLLSRKLGGPSVYPPQPDGLWKAAFNGERTYDTSKGEDRYRRGLYTIWRRTVPYPSMATFDAPSREACTIRRTPTNTPLQAFVTLNDPVYVEAAQALARRIIKEGGADAASRVNFGLQLALARPADPAAATALVKLYESEHARYAAQPEAAKKLATDPLGPLPDGLNAVECAAWTAVANVLLNLDAVLMKG